jgi:hypothetical protein
MKIFKALCSVPGFGIALRISNAYAFHGDLRANKMFAGWKAWSKAVGPELLIASLLTTATAFNLILGMYSSGVFSGCDERFICKPGALLVSILPSILGFGIGVYALIFALSPQFLKLVSRRISTQIEGGDREFGSVLMLNADLAYPLVVLVNSLAIGVVQQMAPSFIPLVLVCWVAAWYSVLCLLSLVAVIHGLADHSLLEKVKPKPSLDE